MDNDLFKINLKKEKTTYEILHYKKENEKFINDYAVVRAYSKNNKELNQKWLGIIDKEYETVIDFKQWKNIELFPNNQALVQRIDIHNNTITYHIDLNERIIKNIFNNYQKLNDNVIIAESEGKVGLYDIRKSSFISNLFDEIKPFEKINNTYVALAIKYLNKEENNPLSIMCYINSEGKISSPIYNEATNTYEEITKYAFDNYVKEEQQKLLNQPTKKDIIKKLQLEIK